MDGLGDGAGDAGASLVESGGAIEESIPHRLKPVLWLAYETQG